jgi:23S rRNA (adenine2503-C2)-methyltransferase
MSSVPQTENVPIPMGQAPVLKRLVDISSAKVEAIYLNRPEKQVVCFTTQLNCPVGCKFCASPSPEAAMNLTTQNMVQQCTEILEENAVPGKVILFSVMGEGEPLLNYHNVVAAMHQLPALYPNCRLALSTSGAAPKRIVDLSEEDFSVPFKLQVSMHILDAEKRKRIMPLVKTPREVIDAMEVYRANKPDGPIELNFTLMDGINDTYNDIEDIKAHLDTGWYIKLGRYNEIPTAPFSGSKRVEWFANELRANGYTVEVHASDGSKDGAACGQTSGLYSRKK